MSDPGDALFEMLIGHWRVQTVHAGVKLGVFEALADGRRSAEEVAEARDLDPDNTYRLLRALGTLGVLEEGADAGYALTERGQLLTRDHPRTLRSMFLLGGGYEYPAWHHLPELIRSGEENAFEKEYGHPDFEYREVDPTFSEVFDQAMTDASRMEADTVVRALDAETLAGVGHLCDVAGGDGYLLARLLQEHADMTGEVLEVPSLVEEAGAVPAQLGVEDRMTFTAGDMFESVPEADGYLMKHNLHQWSDEECVRILETIRDAASSGAPFFTAEYVVPGAGAPHFAKLFDLQMLVVTGGCQRTIEEYETLFRRAGLELVAHHRVESEPISVVEGRVR